MARISRPAMSAACALALSAGAAHAQQFKMLLPADPHSAPAWTQPIEPRILENGPVVVCFAEGTNPLYAAAITDLTNAYNQQFGAPPDYFTFGSWSSQGTPRALTWSFVPDGTSTPGLSGQGAAASNLFASMDAAFAAQGGRAMWVSRFTQSFARWQQLSGLSYTRVTVGGNDWDDGAAWGSAGLPGARGDIRIGMRLLDGNSNVLAFNQFPPNTGGSGDMVLDSGDANGNFNAPGNSHRFLRNVVMHEHGHGMGLQHVCSLNSVQLMEPFIDTSFDGPRQDDIRGAQFLYGDPFESNNSFGTADALGALSTGTPINSQVVPNPTTGVNDPNCSIYAIEAGSAADWYSFTVASATQATISIIPVGSTYDSSQQSGGCPGTASNVNALAMGNLAVDVYASNGTTLVGNSNTAIAGLTETLNVALTTPGTYFMRVFAANAPAQTQHYRFTIVTSNPCPSFTQQPAGGDFCDGALIGLTVNATGAPAPTYQWRKDGNNIPGATLATYAIGNATSGNSGTYDCVATNSCGSTTSDPAVVRVTSSPEITTQPASQTLSAGSTAVFTVVSPTPDPITYQWTKDGGLISGANLPTLTIPNIESGDEGEYRCFLNNLCGSLFSSTATLTIGTTTSCYANCDGSTSVPILNVNDFICFNNLYAAGSSTANCDGSTSTPVLNVNDFTCFLNAYAVGCQ